MVRLALLKTINQVTQDQHRKVKTTYRYPLVANLKELSFAPKKSD